MQPRYAQITGWGYYVPEKVLTNTDLEKMVDTSEEWILQRTGIKERRLRTENDTNTSMSVAAAHKALEVAGLTPKDLDFIICSTTTPDYLLPAAGSLVQGALGAECGAMQVSTACSGWVYGAVMADSLIRSGMYNTILVVGAEIISHGIDYTDRTTCILFGDGAAATIFQVSDKPTGIIASELGSDGAKARSLWVPGGGTTTPISQQVVEERSHYILMDGQEVFKFATRVLVDSLSRVVTKAGLTMNDIDLFIPHQANARIIESAARMMGLPLEKFFINIHKYGNTSAASVPLALVEAIQEGRIQDGDTIAVAAFGGGLSWGSAVVQMGVKEKHALYQMAVASAD